MYDFLLRPRPLMAGLATVVFLAGCAAPVTTPTMPTAAVPKCVAAAMGEPLIGNWLSIRKQKGVAGELRTLFTLNVDGTMAYTEQLKRGKNPSQGLEEGGCWRRDKQMLVLQTLESNGAPVSLDDPIYTNRYTVVSASAKALTVKSQDGASITARRMSPGYRLPF